MRVLNAGELILKDSHAAAELYDNKHNIIVVFWGRLFVIKELESSGTGDLFKYRLSLCGRDDESYKLVLAGTSKTIELAYFEHITQEGR